MKTILGLDLGTNSIGWALVNEAENLNENSEIIKLGVRVNPLTVDELQNFEKGKSITTNADRTLKRSMRRNLQRYKLRRDNLIEILKENGFITDETIFSENGNYTTFETYRLRAKSATEEISLEQFARVLLMINKKRGYKSSRKAKGTEEGVLIDGMEFAKKLYELNLTPGQLSLEILKSGKKNLPDFYRSDLQAEFNKIFDKQQSFYPDILSSEIKKELIGKKRDAIWAICAKSFKEKGFDLIGIKRQGSTSEQKVENFTWRTKGLIEKLSLEQIVIVLQQINSQLNNSSGYLGEISDRSKELYFKKKTVGQYQMDVLDKNPNASLRNMVFYRQDYLDEFEKIWETQAQYHPELTQKLKAEIRDIVIFYQRKLKSQKGLISFCEFESRKIEVEVDGKKKIKTVGSRVCPKSSPLFQEFKIWQILNNIEVKNKDLRVKKNKKNQGNLFENTEDQLMVTGRRFLFQEEKEILYNELIFKEKLSKKEALELLFENANELDLNYKSIDGNKTMAVFFKTIQTIIEHSGHDAVDFSKMSAPKILETTQQFFQSFGYNTELLKFDSCIEGKEFENQAFYQFWHLIYSFEGDDSISGIEKLVNKISAKYGFEKEYALLFADMSLVEDYGSLSTKAIRKIIPHLKEGNEFSVACTLAGYRHSKNSLTAEELAQKVLKDKIEILPKNSLRNPVVEKILNQMINVVNLVSETYRKPDEIRIELARELKQSAEERELTTQAINKATLEHEKYRNILQKEFGVQNVSRNDIIRYKLYLELEDNGFKTLYSNTYIPQEKLFSKEFDIEHIIPQSRLFDDSFSNKTLESRSVNIEKGNETAFDFVKQKENENGFESYLNRIEDLFKNGKISKTKYNKLRTAGIDIKDGFIERDLRDTQYIARKAKSILEELVKDVVSTTGSITDRLRTDWQLVDVMQELNWEKYNELGLTEIIEDKDGRKIKKIKDWTKRNDHRHHAMDALTIAFTKRSFIQYLNNLNARSDKSGSIYGIENKELYRNDKGKFLFKPPFDLNSFRAEAKKHLENTLISIKTKNKVATININQTNKKTGINKKKQLTPRGQLHLETIYGSMLVPVIKEEKVNGNCNENFIEKVTKPIYKELLKKRLIEFGNDAKKAFTGKNSLEKNPIYLDSTKTKTFPDTVKTQTFETIYTIRKEINKDLNVSKVIDEKIKKILEKRLQDFDNDPKKAFSNIDENPIWLNEKKGIAIRRVTISGISNAKALHHKRDKEGKLLLDKQGNKQAVDFVNTGNNHHVAIYKDANGNLQENVVTFFEATERVNQGLPIIDKNYKQNEGWQFLFTMKQNEYFVFPNEKTGFNPSEVDLLNPENYHLISPNLFRVQTMSKVIYGNNIIRDYKFRHHIETKVQDVKELKDIAFKQFKTLVFVNNIVKVRINHIGQIVSIGEY